MASLSNYRLNNPSEIETVRNKIGSDKYEAYRKTVFNLLQNMNPGDTFIIADKVKPANQEVFIKTACLYMISTGKHCNIIFSDDYTLIRGVLSYEQETAQQNDFNKRHEKYKQK